MDERSDLKLVVFSSSISDPKPSEMFSAGSWACFWRVAVVTVCRASDGWKL